MAMSDGTARRHTMRVGLRDRLLGPRVPAPEALAHRRRYARPVWCFTGAAFLLVVSIFLPYWRMDLHAPQYPQGLHVRAYVNRMVGDLHELEGLNRYVGLPSLTAAASFERSVSVAAALVLAGLLLAGLLIHSRWVVVLALPALLFPFGFLADLQYWLWKYGHGLDPKAPLSHAVGSFTQPMIGVAKVAQFHTLALPDVGLLLALGASGLTALGLWYHRRAFKPLYDAMVAQGG